MDTMPAATAQSLRQQYRENQANLARLRLLHDAARAMAAGGDAAVATVLAYALEFAAFEAGAVLLEDAGALRVEASKGSVLPYGIRFPVQGILTALLEPDAQVTIRENAVSRLLLPAGGMAALEVLFPLRRQGGSRGLLVLISRQKLARPAPADMLALSTLATLLALALHEAPIANGKKISEDLKRMSALLTPREREVLALLPSGLTNADIGLRLGIATGTVKVHVERIIHKLQLQDRTQVAAFAVELGLGSSGARR